MSKWKETIKVGYDLYVDDKRYIVYSTSSWTNRDKSISISLNAIPYERCNPIVESHINKRKPKKK